MKFHIVLTEKDADIIAFKNFVPRGEFNECVIKILRHAIKGKVVEMPMCFDIDVLAQRTHTKVDLPKELVRQCYDKLGFESGRFTTGVKAEIRKAINKNRKDTSCSHMTVDEIKDMFQAAERIMKTLHSTSSFDFEQSKRILNGYYTLLIVLMVVINRHMGQVGEANDEP